MLKVLAGKWTETESKDGTPAGETESRRLGCQVSDGGEMEVQKEVTETPTVSWK